MASKGTIIHKRGKAGKIRGDDNRVYNFNQKGMLDGKIEDAKKGQQVTFEPDGGRARSIRLLSYHSKTNSALNQPVVRKTQKTTLGNIPLIFRQ